MTRRGVDLWALAAAVLALVMTGVYLRLIDEQDGEAALWYVAILVLGAVAAGYGSVRSLRRRTPALLLAGLLLGAAGVLGILTIGLPILVAGCLSLVAAARSGPPRASTEA